MRPIPKRAVDFIAQFEGLRLESYLCPAGVWTIGYGHTGLEVTGGMRITEAKARDYLYADIRVAAAKLEAIVGRDAVDSLSADQYVAILSFVFNLGLRAEWQIAKRLKAQEFDQVPAQMNRFINANGKPLKGLIARRAAEAALWSAGAADEEELPSSYTREEPTPPTPEPTKPLAKSRTIWTALGQVVAGISGAALAIQQTIAPHAASAAFLGKAVAVLGVVLAGCGVALLAIKAMEKREAAR